MKVKSFQKITAGLLLAALLSGCAQTAKPQPDAVSSASINHYQENTLSKEELLEAINNQAGGCTIATVNEDGSPNLIIAVPGLADENHIVFGWADNATKANVLRDKEAVIAYYIYDVNGADKDSMYSGARIKVELEEDETVIKELFEKNPDLSQIGTILKIKEILPIG